MIMKLKNQRPGPKGAVEPMKKEDEQDVGIRFVMPPHHVRCMEKNP
jgi:hypothetical protein